MSRTVKRSWWLALAVTLGVSIISGAAQAVPIPYQVYHDGLEDGATKTYTGIQSDTEPDASGWAAASIAGNTRQDMYPTGTSGRPDVLGDVNGQYGSTVRIVDETGTVVSTLFRGDAGMFNWDEAYSTIDGPAFVAPSRQRFETDSQNHYADVGGLTTTQPVPESETLVHMGLGLVGLAVLAKAQI